MKSILVFLIGMSLISCHKIKDNAIMNKKIATTHRYASRYLPEHTIEAKQLKHFATYADGIRPHYKQILKQKVAGKFTFTSLVADAHALNLKGYPYTLRADVLDAFSSFEEMMETLLISTNADGAFTDFPDLVVHYLNTKK
jgi:glycerophosphoryl diester phosphodiesterase